MNTNWAFVLLLALSNIGHYLFAPPSKKREAAAQAPAGSLALVGGYYVGESVQARLIAARVPFVTTLLFMTLALVAASLAIVL